MKPKKKLLFIIPYLDFGGAEKSLHTLLSLIDTSRYDTDLFLFLAGGGFLATLPESVRILPQPESYRLFTKPLQEAVRLLLKKRRPLLAVERLWYSVALRRSDKIRTAEQLAWKHLAHALPVLDGEYDAAIAYLEGSPIYFCVDKVRAKKKLAYIHSDYGKLETNIDFDRRYFEKVDNVVTVSDECAAILKKTFPSLKTPVNVIENITSPAVIKSMAESGKSYNDDFTGFRLLTVGRISEPKGIDIAAEACAMLCRDGYNIRWYVLGDGDMRGTVESLTEALGITDRFILLGSNDNPYPFIKDCDVYVQPSRFEGKSIAIEEAKCLAKPIVVTCFTTVHTQIEDGKTGLIAEISPESIAEKIKCLLDNPSLRDELTKNLYGYAGNENELEKFYNLINK